MRIAQSTVFVALLSLLSGCGFTTIESQSCPDAGTSLTWQNFGQDFLNRWCQNCHGSEAVDRAGAPGEFIFDNVSQVRRHARRIFARSAGTNDSMPPGPLDPSLEDRNRLAEWLVCGAP